MSQQKTTTRDIFIYSVLALLTVLSMAIFIGLVQLNSDGRLGEHEVMLLVIGIPLGLLLYFLPSILGRKKRNHNAIFALNLLLGWSLIGWVVALVWAVSQDTKHIVVQNTSLSTTEELEKLAQLYERGVLSEQEFAQQKKRILG